jgi:hypothetical protein
MFLERKDHNAKLTKTDLFPIIHDIPFQLVEPKCQDMINNLIPIY